MSQPGKVVPAQLGFLAIYNPSLGTTDETIENQIVYYSSTESREGTASLRSNTDQKALQDATREQKNEELRQIGLAQGMVEFGRSFSDGKSVDTIETEKSRIVLHELEAGWWILASINLTILPGISKTPAAKGKAAEEKETIEYSTREVKPAILILGDILQAHSTFLLHHASSMSALFVRTRRSKFVGILARYWDTFLSTWNVLMHGNPANNLYGGIKIAACGELGMGVGEEERGSGEREVLEGFLGRIDGLVDVVVSKFGDRDPNNDLEVGASKKGNHQVNPTEPWLGSGNEPGAEDGVIFLGAGAISRKSLRDLSHWVEDLYRWGPNAYGVIDNPTSNRRTKRSKDRPRLGTRDITPESKKKPSQGFSLTLRDKVPRLNSPLREEPLTTITPSPVDEDEIINSRPKTVKRPSFHRGPSSHTSSENESTRGNKLVQYLKLGYGTHWSLGGSLGKDAAPVESQPNSSQPTAGSTGNKPALEATPTDGKASNPPVHDDSTGHYLIGLMGDIEKNDDEESAANDPRSFMQYRSNSESQNERLLLRTLTVELEREEDARAEADISIDLGTTDKDTLSSKNLGSEHTGTSSTSFESQDRNKTKKLRVVVYVSKPFIFVFLFELRADSLALTSLYRSLHYQIGPLIKPLLASTSFRASRPELSSIETPDPATPIYDLVWDPKTLTVNSTIPNIPDPHQTVSKNAHALPWSRVEALNTHMQIVNTYIASTSERAEIERTCKTSRGWWVVYCRIPDPEPSVTPLASGTVKIPTLIAEDSDETQDTSRFGFRSAASQKTSTFGASQYSGPAHPFLDTPSNGQDSVPKDKEIILIRRASDHVAAKSSSRFPSGSSTTGDASWTTGPGKLAQGIGVDTKRYIEGLLNLNR